MLPYILLFLMIISFCLNNYGKCTEQPILEKWIPLVVVACFGGLRYQTGYDWQAYTTFFEDIPINGVGGILGADYDGSLSLEPGYYALNYIVKALGLPFEIVFIISAVFSVWTFGHLLGAIRCNAPLAILFYVGFSLILFHFSIVRQSIAVSFAFLACRSVIQGEKFFKVISYILLGTLFQVSALMYFPILALGHSRARVNISLFAIPFVGLVAAASYFDFSKLIVNFAANNLGLDFFAKYDSYLSVEHSMSLATYGLLLLNVVTLLYISNQPNNSEKAERLTRLAEFSTLFLIMVIIIFPGNSSVWSRLMMFTATLQGMWFSSHNLLVSRSRAVLVTLICIGVSFFIYSFSIYSNSDFLVPYQSIFHKYYLDTDSTNEFNTLEVMKQ